jgi:GTPase Era involved in 16S rRNA processing
LNVVSIIGPSRIGKSTLMSKLYGDRDIQFETSSDPNVPCTDGIVALREPIKELDLNMILMDCKGFNNAHDAQKCELKDGENVKVELEKGDVLDANDAGKIL